MGHYVYLPLGLGADASLQRLADGSTPAGREIYAALVSKAVYDLAEDIQSIINNRFSGLRVLLRPAPFIPQTAQRKAELVLAREELSKEFLPVALTSIRDYQRPLSEVQEGVDAYFDTLARQIGAATSAEARTTLAGFWLTVSREAARLAVQATAATSQQLSRLVAEAAKAAARETAKQAVMNPLFGLLVLGVGAVGLSYVWRTFEGGLR